MYYETVKIPSKCSHDLWIIKVNKQPEITLPAVHYMYVIKFELESPLSAYHIFSYSDFHSLFPVKKYKSNRCFSCKAPRLAFSFLPPVIFQIFTAGFSSRIFIFPLVHWLKKSDYSSLQHYWMDSDIWKSILPKFLFKIIQLFSKQHAGSNIGVIKNSTLKEFLKFPGRILEWIFYWQSLWANLIPPQAFSCKFMIVLLWTTAFSQTV